jgi:hypothetical protein
VGTIAPICNLSSLPISIRLLWNFTDEATHRQKWQHLISDQIQFAKDPADIQYTIVVNAANQMTDPTKTIYFCMEPNGETQYGAYLSLLNREKNALFLGLHAYHLNNAEWHLSKSLGQLKQHTPIKKHDKVLSVVVSDKAQDPGHIYRLALIKKLDELCSLKKLPFTIDIYGKCASLKFKHYKGELPEQQKDDALFPYKYHLNVENHYTPNYITEKLYDSICAECYTFYKGASNFRTFFKAEGIHELSGTVNQIDEDIKQITEKMQGDAFEHSISSIRANKARILNEYAFEPRVKSIVTVSQALCYAVHPEIQQWMQVQGFRNVESLQVPVDISRMCTQALKQAQPLLFIMSNQKYENMYDQICFAIAREPDSDFYAFRDPSDGQIDICIMPSGCEKILLNANKKRNIFIGLKYASVGV